MNAQYFVDVMTSRQKFIYRSLDLIRLLCLIYFWYWWVNSSHIFTVVGFVITSYVLALNTIVPIWSFYFAGRAKKPNPRLPLPNGRIAMVATAVPSESEIVKATLVAMLNQDFPNKYSVFLCHEDPTPSMVLWCEERGITLVTRKGVAGYHNEKWPRRAKSKEGNLAYFYDTIGYKDFDYVVQLDADHIPDPDYLRNMIAPFIDPQVGYVAAPSICDANAKSAWTVNARLYAEAITHGILQAGYNDGWAPMCIGSHYAVRTSALKESGGLGPELAEDHSTTMILIANGWKGAFAFDATAHGDGAESLADSITQEFQWSRSLMNVFLQWTPKYLGKMKLRHKFQFLFIQLWYPIFATQMVLGILSPGIALFTDLPWVKVGYFDFLWRYVLLTFTTLLPFWFIQSQGWLRPKNSPLMSWQASLFQIIRWPWAALGILFAFIDSLSGKAFPFKVTPKRSNDKPLPIKTVAPYLVIIVFSSIAVILKGNPEKVYGYYLLACVDILAYSVATVLVIWLHIRDNVGVNGRRVKVLGSGLATAFALVLVGFTSFTVLNRPLPSYSKDISGELVVVDEPYNRSVVSPMPSLGQVIASQVEAVDPVQPTATATPYVAPVVRGFPDELCLGAYDPKHLLSDMNLCMDHYFVSWNSPYIGGLIENSQRKGHRIMLTTTLFPDSDRDLNNYYLDIQTGYYDRYFIDFAEVVKQYPGIDVIVRPFHEMDLIKEGSIAGLYPWSQQKPHSFVIAYKHMVDLFREMKVDNAKFVWSPAGNVGSMSYYPGDDYVDYFGITILNSEEWVIYFGGGKVPSFTELMNERRKNLAPVIGKKPLIVTEFGISYVDRDKDRLPWLKDAFAAFGEYPDLVSVVFFNEINPENNNAPGQPDWRLDAAIVEQALK